MQILHHGAADGVTGSCHQLVIDAHHSLLVDCGLFQGAETSADGDGGAGRPEIEFDIRSVKALVTTHVHIDHVGRLPWLLAAGFKGPILCSEPSAKLLPLVLEDAFRLAISREPAAVQRYLKLVAARIVAIPYKTWYSLIDTPEWHVRLRLQRAGHILGSAWVECDVHDRIRANSRRVVFSGDLGAPYAPLLTAPAAPYAADTVVLESTYGNRNHPSRADRRRRLQAVVEKALADHGTVLVPAFSIGRTQELIYEFEDIVHHARRKGADTPWPDLPILLDSPLASRFSRVYGELQPYWDAEAHQRLARGRNPLDFPNLHTVDSHADHLAMVRSLSASARPAIVIAASGMCSGGRIVNYLKAMLGDARHNVLFVGYQARGTPGQAIQQYGPQGGYVDLDGDRIHIRAGIETLGGYSAHADQRGLINFITRMRHWPSEIRLVHGEPAAKRELATALMQRYAQKRLAVEILGV